MDIFTENLNGTHLREPVSVELTEVYPDHLNTLFLNYYLVNSFEKNQANIHDHGEHLW